MLRCEAGFSFEEAKMSWQGVQKECALSDFKIRCRRLKERR